jgi:putative membrane protein insertion efficiency factor
VVFAEAAEKRRISHLMVAALAGYKRWVSPLLPPACRFEPTCSVYMREAIAVHGAARGLWLGVLRLGRCHPFHPGGFDPVPPKKERL